VNGCQDDILQTRANWKGFKLMGDNIESLHCSGLIPKPIPCTAFITMPRVDLSACSEVVPTDLKDIVVGMSDVTQLECDSITLILR